MDISAIALQGLDQASAQLDRAASNIAAAGGSSPDGAGLDTVALSEEAVALMSAKALFSANLSVLRTADQIQKNTIDAMA